MSDLKTITETLISGDVEALMSQVKEALEKGTAAGEILANGLIAGMDIVGERMETGEMFIPEVLMSAHAMGEAVEILKPLLAEGETNTAGRVIIGTVKGDLHDIGKNLVSMMLESAGFEVTDLGVDVDADAFMKAIEELNPHIVGLSALLTTTIPAMRDTVDRIVQSGKKDSIKIMVGGAPVNQAFADEIGADAYASDAGSACKLAKAMLR
ncbi:corrinoid protein [Desulfoluna sp.]|uniref:corrinoid protein n=1 Tax=Desulfoluna sp. TaxID=2045199 RepID=UPI0026166C39|nr:corrinoid protein [Desulfoluna sp.]